jgi:hypothetical protein
MRIFRTIISGAIFGALFLLLISGFGTRTAKAASNDDKCRSLHQSSVNELGSIIGDAFDLSDGQADFSEEDFLSSLEDHENSLNRTYKAMNGIGCRDSALSAVQPISTPQCRKINTLKSDTTDAMRNTAGLPYNDSTVSEIRNNLQPIQSRAYSDYCSTPPNPNAPLAGEACVQDHITYHYLTLGVLALKVKLGKKDQDPIIKKLDDIRRTVDRVSIRITCMYIRHLPQ